MMCFGLKDRKRLKTNHCVIVLLDDTQLVHELHPSSTGQDLLDVVIKHLNLLETSYFGLKYYPQGSSPGGGHYAPAAPPGRGHQPVWLDMERAAIKQLRDANPMTVHFGVKYYATDPCKLAEEITRYQFFLQCKQDILSNRLAVSFELAIELFGLAIQSELGDYDPSRHLENYASEFQFVQNQTLELEQRAALYHRQLVGQVPATAELNFLERVKWLDLYGCQLHLIQYDEFGQQTTRNNRQEPADLFALGLNPSGVLVLRNRLKVAQYFWSRIVKTKCQGRCFLMDVIDGPGMDQQQFSGGLLATTINMTNNSNNSSSAKRNRFGFRLADKEASRRLRWAIEEHKHFYHLIHSTATLNQLARHQRQQQQQQQQQQQHEQRLRSSMKSILNQQMAPPPPRPPPMVVRTPSRRYSNRSLPRPTANSMGQLQAGAYNNMNRLLANSQAAANGNGLPPPVGMSNTLVPNQRQQAMLLMANQQQAYNFIPNQRNVVTKSQTLRPMSSKEAKQRGYYQMMLSAGGGATGDRPALAEVSILQPGQHTVQPAIYRATSVVDGINQLADVKQHFRPTMMQQFFNTRPRRSSGHESPRSTKSAMVPSSAMKLASKRLAKQQLLYGMNKNDLDARPLLDYGTESAPRVATDQLDLYYANGAPTYYSAANGAYSASASPRNAFNRALSRSRSTGENLHLVHKQQAAFRANSKMLLATVNPVSHQQHLAPTAAHNLPPPDYNSSSGETPAHHHHHHHHHQRQQQHRVAPSGGGTKMVSINTRRNNGNGDDDYYCSRSDCSSIDDGDHGEQRGKARQARFINGRLVNVGPKSQMKHTDSNNNQLVGPKNIANKQATPILLTMNQHFGSNLSESLQSVSANSKAVQMLNIQRQQLQQAAAAAGQTQQQLPPPSSAATAAQLDEQRNKNGIRMTTLNSSGSDSAGSSVASSPQLPPSGNGETNVHNHHNQHEQQKQQQQQQRSFSQRRRHHNAADSAGSSSTTTSGYYAGSNSTEVASVDSDTISADCQPQASDLHDSGGSRAKIALSLHAPQGPRRLAGLKAPKSSNYHHSNQQQQNQRRGQDEFHYQDELTGSGQPQPGPNGPSSLKYVSFDV